MEKLARLGLNWNYLQYFCAVAEHKSIKLASEDLGVSSSSVSEGIQSLELKLNCKLLARHTRRVELTAAGGSLYDSLKPIFEKQHQILESWDSRDFEIRSLHFGLVPSNSLLASLSLFQMILRSISAHKFVVHNCSQESLERLMSSGEIDVGFSESPIKSRSATSVKIGDCGIRYFVHRELADQPVSELLKTMKIGLLGAEHQQLEFQSRLDKLFPEISPQFLITDFATLLYEACLQKLAIVGYAADSKIPQKTELVEVRDPVLNGEGARSEHFLSWANRIEGSSIHTLLLSLVKSL
jgi:DNA-binding transcriptional LysR family regulator